MVAADGKMRLTEAATAGTLFRNDPAEGGPGLSGAWAESILLPCQPRPREAHYIVQFPL